MTALAPASLSISAETSPVKAPEACAWQSWAPIATAAAVGSACELRDEGRRRAHHEVDGRGQLARALDYAGKFGRRGPQAVHLPIARNEWARRDGICESCHLLIKVAG